MLGIIEEDLYKVLEKYSIDVISIRTESYKDKKGVWWIETPEGYKILKKHANSDRILEFIIAAVEHLQARGIRIPQIIPAYGGGKYVFVNNNCYLLSEAISGRNPVYNNPNELAAVAGGLARFHSASTGFVPPPGCKPRIHLGGWLESYRKRKDKIEAFYADESASKDHQAFGKVFLNEFPYFSERIRKSIEGLEGSYYRQWVQEVQDTGSLCHQDFAAGNLILTEDGELYVLDIDSITIDIPIRDIRKLLLKVMKKRGGWDSRLAKDILKAYQTENPLEPEQWQVLKWELLYPHLFDGIVSKYYEKREKTWTIDKYYKRLVEMVGVERSIDSIIDAFDDLIPQ